ncbi:helix-turn-helix transcriptional regulator [Vibrio rotiferianus]|uniref:Helix-turn-helix transcriptional regulator n=1 Tax=Vibrio rotiferianus TaxID=190895 RepID=A0A7Y4E0H5_9VIBR|nr:AraC family transcriptional regulator [Vibrio rotiferianus]NOH47158.1 helix-turn-helix transcriptional regulator [Vibrio rotiferianus]
MEELTKTYWIGKSVQSLPSDFRSKLFTFFAVTESHEDTSVVSDKNFTHFFYYADSEHTYLHKSMITLCENLDKKLIVLYDKHHSAELPPERIAAEYHQIHSDKPGEWLSKMKLKYFSPSDLLETTLSNEISVTKHGKSNFSDVVHYIANNVHKNLREDEAAAICHCSPNYFSKLFHRKVGMCFRDYVTEKRISLAKKMLTEEDSMKIAYIAYQCGYRDVSYFSRIFKKKTGLSPASYRQRF